MNVSVLNKYADLLLISVAILLLSLFAMHNNLPALL